MAVKIFNFFALLFIISFNSASSLVETVDGKIKITIGTMSGCSDAVRFIPSQLAETYEAYKDFLIVEFVPWGRTVRNADNSLTCWFGVNDCWANRLHRCALDMLSSNQDAQVDYMICEFTNPRPGFLQGSYYCAQAAGLRLVDIDFCVTTTGDHLDAESEAAAELPMSVINFVPSIHFNDVPNRTIHDAAYARLKSVICFALADDPTTGVTGCQI